MVLQHCCEEFGGMKTYIMSGINDERLFIRLEAY